MYNLKDAAGSDVTDLRLSGTTIAKIFTAPDHELERRGDHRRQRRPRRCPRGTSRPSSGPTGRARPRSSRRTCRSGTRDLWCAFAQAHGINPCNFTSNWPAGVEGYRYASGSDGVANDVAARVPATVRSPTSRRATPCSAACPSRRSRTQSGNFALPTSKNVSIALTKATLNADRTQKLDDVYTNPDPRTYPMSSYSYMIVPTKGFNSEKGKVLGKFMIYFACTGQRKADQLGYSPLPPNLVRAVFDAVKQVPGAPTPPPVEPSKCPNPTLSGGGTSNNTGDDLSDAGGDDGVVGSDEPAGGSGGGGGAGGGGTTGGAGSGGGTTGGANGAGGTGTTGTTGGGTTGGTTGAGGNGAGGTAGYTGGTTGGGASNQALPEIDLTAKPPSWLPLAFGGALLLLIILVPPAFAIAGKKRRPDQL